jgi:hypothetical protein
MNQNKKRRNQPNWAAPGDQSQAAAQHQPSHPSPHSLSLSLTARLTPPVGAIVSNAGRYSPLAPLTLCAIKPTRNRLQVPRDPLSHPLFFSAQELAARPRIWSKESADVDAVRH